LRDGPWHTQLFVTTGALPIAVRVDVLSPNADNDAVLAHGAVAIPGASEASNPPATPTSATPLTLDPDPEPLPPGPDRLPALRTEDSAASGSAPDRLGLDGWQDAATKLITTVIDEDSPGGPPAFAEVSEDADNLVVRGRYAMPDGDAGTFEIVRLGNGDWGMTSLRSDGLELGQIGRTGARVQVTLVSAQDADLGVGGFRVGLEPGQPWVKAGEEAVFSVPCRDSVAVLYQFLDATMARTSASPRRGPADRAAHPARTADTPGAPAPTTAKVCAWARTQGIDVPAKGRLRPERLVRAWGGDQANSPERGPAARDRT
jgi:hypothetical protein